MRKLRAHPLGYGLEHIAGSDVLIQLRGSELEVFEMARVDFERVR